MSGSRTNLGTVVELSEAGDEAASLLVPTTPPPATTAAPAAASEVVRLPTQNLDGFSFRRSLPRRRALNRLNIFNVLSNIRSAAPSSSSSSKSKRVETETSFNSSTTSGSGASASDDPLASATNSTTPASILRLEGMVESKTHRPCPVCFFRQPKESFPKLSNCSHLTCRTCLRKYLLVEIMESRVNISCPECSEPLHQNDIYSLLEDDKHLIEKYEMFSLRRVLSTDPDTRYCPAPDCMYAVIAASCAECPQLKCMRPGCGTFFCYHCKNVWHPNQTCDEARRERAIRANEINASSGPGPSVPLQAVHMFNERDSTLKPGDIKACPCCRTLIVKMNDGSCNHMMCAICGTEFCWLCLKVITDLHYLSPTGCTFWGKKQWTRKKKLLWQIGTLIGAPVGITLIAGLAVPAIIFGVPIFIGRKAYQRFDNLNKGRRRFITVVSVAGSFVVSPVLAVMAVGVGVPIMLAYVYGVVPLSLCRNGGCGGSEGEAQEPGYGEEDDEIANLTAGFGATNAHDRSRLINSPERADTSSVGDTVSGTTVGLRSGSTGGTSCKVHAQNKRRLSVDSTGVTSLGERVNFEKASVNAMAGSRYDNKSLYTVCSDGHEAQGGNGEMDSIVGLAGSVLDAKSLTDSCGRHVTLTPAHSAEDPKTNGESNTFDDSASLRSKGTTYPLAGANSNAPCASSAGRAKSKSPASVGPEDLAPAEFYCADFQLQGVSEAEDGQVDPYKVHHFMDNLKQILNDDVPNGERPVKKFKPRHPPNLRAHSLTSTGAPVTAQVSDEGTHAVITPVEAPATGHGHLATPATASSTTTTTTTTSSTIAISSAASNNPATAATTTASTTSPKRRSLLSRLFYRGRKGNR